MIEIRTSNLQQSNAREHDLIIIFHTTSQSKPLKSGKRVKNILNNQIKGYDLKVVFIFPSNIPKCASRS